MLKIGEFSKLSQLTVKALRFYEREGVLVPSEVDSQTGYRLYTTSQLTDAAKVKQLRQLGFSVEEVKKILAGTDAREALQRKAEELRAEQTSIAVRISIIDHLLKEREMGYQVTEKTIPAATVYYSEATLEKHADAMQWIPAQGAEFRALNPNLKCADSPYEFVEYLDDEHRERYPFIQDRVERSVELSGDWSDMGKGILAKAVAVAAVLAIAFAMVACAKSTLAVDSDEQGVHAVAENGASGSATGHIAIEPGYGLCINHIVEKGSFHVKAVDGQGAVVFDDDLTDNIADFVPAAGEIDLVISSDNATGTVDVIAYDVEAQAQADAELEELASREGIDVNLK